MDRMVFAEPLTLRASIWLPRLPPSEVPNLLELICRVLKKRFDETPSHVFKIDFSGPWDDPRAPSRREVPDTGPERPDYSIEMTTRSYVNPVRREILADAIEWGCDWVAEARAELAADQEAATG